MIRTHAVDGMENETNWISIYASFLFLSFSRFLFIDLLSLCLLLAFSSGHYAWNRSYKLASQHRGALRKWRQVTRHFSHRDEQQKKDTKIRTLAEFVFIKNSSTEEAKACKLKYLRSSVEWRSCSEWFTLTLLLLWGYGNWFLLLLSLLTFSWLFCSPLSPSNTIISQRKLKWHHRVSAGWAF